MTVMAFYIQYNGQSPPYKKFVFRYQFVFLPLFFNIKYGFNLIPLRARLPYFYVFNNNLSNEYLQTRYNSYSTS